MIEEQKLNTFAGITPEQLQDFINELSWETEKFTYSIDKLIEDVSTLYESTFNESTEAITDSNKLIFAIANNSASLMIEYNLIQLDETLPIVQVKEVYTL